MNDEGWRLLATAIIGQAVNDLYNPKYAEDAEEFLKSKWCENILEGLGMEFNGETILKKARNLNNQKEKMKW